MALDVKLKANGSEKDLLTVPSQVQANSEILIVGAAPPAFGAFKSVGRSSAGTSAIVTPTSGGSVIMTDMIVTASKAATSDVTVRFTDDTNTVDILLSDSINAPINLAIAFRGLWRGWKDARVDLITTGNVIVQVTIGYIKVPDGVPFTEWDALR